LRGMEACRGIDKVFHRAVVSPDHGFLGWTATSWSGGLLGARRWRGYFAVGVPAPSVDLRG